MSIEANKEDILQCCYYKANIEHIIRVVAVIVNGQVIPTILWESDLQGDH